MMKKWTKSISSALLAAMLLQGAHGLAAAAPVAAAAAEDEAGRKTIEVSRTLAAPVIDGSIEEPFWSLTESVDIGLGEGLSTPSAFGLLWDNQYLYVAVDIEDEQLMSGEAGEWFEQDNVSLFFDPTLHRSAPYRSSDMQAGFIYEEDSMTPGFSFGSALNHHENKDEKDILRAIQTTENGWSLEVAVPWEMLEIDPMLQRQLGMELTVADRYGAAASELRSSAWSAYESSSFWNDTQGYGVLTLVNDDPVDGKVDPVLLEEDFDRYADGELPFGWISDENAGSDPFTVVQDVYGNGRMSFSGSSSGKQSRPEFPLPCSGTTMPLRLTCASTAS